MDHQTLLIARGANALEKANLKALALSGFPYESSKLPDYGTGPEGPAGERGEINGLGVIILIHLLFAQRPNPFPCVAVISLVIYKKRMIIISNEAKVKLETLAPKVAKLLLRQFEHLEAAQTRVRLEAEGKIKQLHGLSNTYSLAASPNYLVIFKSQGNDLIISDIVNVAFLEYMRRTAENAKPT